TSITALIFLQNSRRRSRLNAELTERKEEIEYQNEQLYELNAEKDGLISIVAHDLKAPLNKVDGFAQLIPLVGEMNSEQKSYLKKINRATTNGRRLIRDLLDILATENMGSSTEASQFILSQMISFSLEGFIERASQKNIDLTYQYDHADESVVTDRTFLERILDNLVSNAIKFSERNTEVEVRTSLDKDMFCLEVSDQGPGISEDDQKMMFRKFQRLSAQPTGGEASTGLGLSIIKALVERLHGRIEVDSKLGEGTRFSVFLPRGTKVDT
ncbi:MAG: HAMP domain-containing sensor histidine kinase, partial [Bacteroidota bacterium]